MELLVPLCICGLFASIGGSAKAKAFAVFCTVCVFLSAAFDSGCDMATRAFCGFALVTSIPCAVAGAWILLDKETK